VSVGTLKDVTKIKKAISFFFQHVYEEDHQLERSEAKIFHTESPETECFEHPIREGRVAMSLIWNPQISKEVNNAYGMVMFNMQLHNKAIARVMTINHRTVRQQLFLPPPQKKKDYSIWRDTENRFTYA